MKIKKANNKGQVHPFSTSTDFLSLLQLLLPATIFSLTSLLSLSDCEVLAYMITRSLKTTSSNNNNKHSPKNKSPSFDCDCFQCYTSYWFRWDSSPNRELIHQAIEAFEEHLANQEKQQKQSKKTRKRDKVCKREQVDKKADDDDDVVVENVESSVGLPEESDVAAAEVVLMVGSSHKGLARKVLPDVLGIFNSRLWNLWGSNV